MKIIVAPDSFKGSLSAVEAANHIEKGLKRADKSCEVKKVPMADGGEGTVEAMLTAVGGRVVRCRVRGPLGSEIHSFFGILEDGKTAVIEMAAASGLPLIPEEKRNPLLTTTYGTGELIRLAWEYGCKKVILGIGGSGTNDGGMGMAQALGAEFYDAGGRLLGLGGKQLIRVADICIDNMDSSLREMEIRTACDVTNPLCGSNGASAVYGPQKGATGEMVRELDLGLENYARIIDRKLNKSIRDIPGAGAAGGLGGGLLAFLNAKLMPGVDIVIEASGLRDKIRDAGLVITGEGRTDSQTAFGKVPVGIAEAASGAGIPVICLSGGLGKGYEEVYKHGITAAFSIINSPMTLEEAIEGAGYLLEQSAYSIGRLYM